MHPNPIFKKTPKSHNIAFARDRSFGTLAINADLGPLVAHIPFQLSEDGTYLEAHLVRSNPIARALKEPKQAVVAVNGGDGYISPDWYGAVDQVPTWNYVAVHLRGRLRLLADEELMGVLERISTDMEAKLLPKPIWKTDKMTPDVLAKMMRQIVPIAIDIDDIQGTWKLGQNKPDNVRLNAASSMAGTGFGMHHEQIATLMKEPPF